MQARLNLPLLITLALLSTAAPFATDMYLPTFPTMVTELQTSRSAVQLSLTAFLVGAGVGQVVFGPLSDRIGRVGPLLTGTAVYVLAGAGAALAPSIGVLIAVRLAQGLSGAAGMVISRAVISDLARGQEAARAFSLMMLVGGVAPVVAPLAGSLLAGPLGWRGLLWIVAGIGAVAFIATLLFVRETHPAAARTRPRGSGGLRTLLTWGFAGDALAYAFAFSTMMSYISASPFLYQDLMGLSQIEYGLAFGLNALVLTAVGGLAARLTRRFAAAQISRTGLRINLAAIVALFVLALTPVPPTWLALPILVAVSSLGLVLGPVTALALDQVPKTAGLGSAALGLLQFLLAGAIAPLVSLGGGTSALPLAICMLVASVVATCSFVVAGRHRRPSQVGA